MKFWDILSQILCKRSRGTTRANSVHPACPLFSQLFACSSDIFGYGKTSDGRWSFSGRICGPRLCGCLFLFLMGLKMVAKRGEIMSQVSGGGMAAVIALDAR